MNRILKGTMEGVGPVFVGKVRRERSGFAVKSQMVYGTICMEGLMWLGEGSESEGE